MKLAAIFALALLATPAQAQAPQPSSRDPVHERMSTFTMTCPGLQGPDDDPDPTRLEAMARTCETALADLDAYFHSVANPTPRQSAYHALLRFGIQRKIAGHLRLADMKAGIAAGRRIDLTPSSRACRVFESAFESYNSIDWTTFAPRTQSDTQLRIIVDDLKRCRARHGTPAGAAPLPDLPPRLPAAPPPGTLTGDGYAFTNPCMTVVLDDKISVASRIETCERAASVIPAIRALYPTATDGEVFAFEVLAVNTLIPLGLMQLRADVGNETRACANFATAEASIVRMRALEGYASLVRPFDNLVASANENCR